MTDPVRLSQDASITRGATRDGGSAQTRLDRIAALLALFAALGPLIVSRVGRPGVLNPGTGVNTFFEQYRRHEPVFLVITAAFAIAFAVAARRAMPDETTDMSSLGVSQWRLGRLGLVSALVLALASVGTTLVMHALPLSMDEYVAVFQSRIFASGQLRTTVPSTWQDFGWSLTPVFVAYDPIQHTWASQYLPVYSALRAIFVESGADRFVNPVLAALALPLAYACARRLWPEERWRAWLAAGFLASSSQLLFMSMTGYTMPAHLVVNLLWLYAFLRNDRIGWLAAPILGAVALGLHNPFPHALFVAPFLLLILLQRRWGWTVYFAAVYLLAIAGWYVWARSVQMGGQGTSLFGLFQVPDLLMFAVQGLSLTVALSWQTPILALALLWNAAAWRSLSIIERALFAGILLSLAFFLFFPSTQGHGWGYRYTFAVLGNMALLGALGIDAIRKALGDTTVKRYLVASLALTAIVQWPVRAWQVEHYVRPFALAHEYVEHLDADVVIVDPTTSWYGIDLIRNDPELTNRPKILSAFYLRPPDRRFLLERFGDRVHLLEPAEIAQFGIPTFPSRFKGRIWPPDTIPISASR
jgi:hypothetical protein